MLLRQHRQESQEVLMRSFLYALARLLGDINAVQKGRVGRRVGRRIAGKYTARGLWRIFK